MRVLLPSFAGSLYLGQILMHELDDDGTFTDARGDAFYRTVADIADDENAWDVGFEQAGIAIEGPGRGAFAIAKEVWTGEDEAALVAFDETAEPLGARLRANKDEKTGGGKLLAFSRGLAQHGDAGQARFALDFDDRRPRPNLDVGRLLD